MLSFSHGILEVNFIAINLIVTIVFIVINFHPPSVNVMVTDFKIKTFIFIIASNKKKNHNNKSQIVILSNLEQ